MDSPNINFGKLWHKSPDKEAEIRVISKEKKPPIERFGGIKELVDVVVKELYKYDTEITNQIEEFELNILDYSEIEYEIAASRCLLSWVTYFIIKDALLWNPTDPNKFSLNLCHGLIIEYYNVDIDKEHEIDRYNMYWEDINEDHIAFKELLEQKLEGKIDSTEYFLRNVDTVFKHVVTDWSPELVIITIMSQYQVILNLLNTTLLKTVDAVDDNNMYLG